MVWNSTGERGTRSFVYNGLDGDLSAYLMTFSQATAIS